MNARGTTLRRQLSDQLGLLGLHPGSTVLVHCSMRRLGLPPASTDTLLGAIRDAIGTEGTIVVPTHTANNSTTSRAFRDATRGMDAAAVAAYEDTIAAFDVGTTPAYGMGALAEHVRRQPGAIRSTHPQTSFTALGPAAPDLTASHDLVCHLGERSPLAALYAADAHVLLLGVDYSACTAFHLAEYRLPWQIPDKAHRCYVLRDGQRTREDFVAPDLDDSSFAEIGSALELTTPVAIGPVGAATARRIPLRQCVDFAREWMITHRKRHAS